MFHQIIFYKTIKHTQKRRGGGNSPYAGKSCQLIRMERKPTPWSYVPRATVCTDSYAVRGLNPGVAGRVLDRARAIQLLDRAVRYPIDQLHGLRIAHGMHACHERLLVMAWHKSVHAIPYHTILYLRSGRVDHGSVCSLTTTQGPTQASRASTGPKNQPNINKINGVLG